MVTTGCAPSTSPTEWASAFAPPACPPSRATANRPASSTHTTPGSDTFPRAAARRAEPRPPRRKSTPPARTPRRPADGVPDGPVVHPGPRGPRRGEPVACSRPRRRGGDEADHSTAPSARKSQGGPTTQTPDCSRQAASHPPAGAPAAKTAATRRHTRTPPRESAPHRRHPVERGQRDHDGPPRPPGARLYDRRELVAPASDEHRVRVREMGQNRGRRPVHGPHIHPVSGSVGPDPFDPVPRSSPRPPRPPRTAHTPRPRSRSRTPRPIPSPRAGARAVPAQAPVPRIW